MAYTAEDFDRLVVDTAHGLQHQGSHRVPCSEYPGIPGSRCEWSYCSADDVAGVEGDDVAIASDEESVVVPGDCIGTCRDVWLSEIAVVVEVADPTSGSAVDNCKGTVVQRSRRVGGWEIDGASDPVESTAAYLGWGIAPVDSAEAVAANMLGGPSSATGYAAVTSAARLPSSRWIRAEATVKIG